MSFSRRAKRGRRSEPEDLRKTLRRARVRARWLVEQMVRIGDRAKKGTATEKDADVLVGMGAEVREAGKLLEEAAAELSRIDDALTGPRGS